MSTTITALFDKCACALIGYPETWDSASIAVVLAQGCKRSEQPATLVTWNTDLANKILLEDSMNKDNIMLVNYASLTDLTHVRDNLIVFDSIHELTRFHTLDEKVATLDLLPPLIKRGNTVIIMVTLGVRQEDFNAVKRYAPGSYFLWATFLENTHHLQFALHETIMTPAQEAIFPLARQRELEYLPTDVSYDLSQKLCTILLPPPIHETMGTSSEPSVQAMLQIYTTSQGFNLNAFIANGPKLRNLITQLRLFEDMRHVIYTKYDRHYGAQMIGSILTKLGFNVYILSRNLDPAQQIAVVQGFNKGCQPAILVMSAPIPKSEYIYDVSHLHFLDSGYEMYHVLLDKIYKHRLYKCFMCNLFIHNYICQSRGNIPSADKVLYDRFMVYQNTILDMWDQVKTKGYPISLDEDGKLAVTTKKDQDM